MFNDVTRMHSDKREFDRGLQEKKKNPQYRTKTVKFVRKSVILWGYIKERLLILTIEYSDIYPIAKKALEIIYG